MELIDTHCHLYLPDFAGDIGDVIGGRRCRAEPVLPTFH